MKSDTPEEALLTWWLTQSISCTASLLHNESIPFIRWWKTLSSSSSSEKRCLHQQKLDSASITVIKKVLKQWNLCWCVTAWHSHSLLWGCSGNRPSTCSLGDETHQQWFNNSSSMQLLRYCIWKAIWKWKNMKMHVPQITTKFLSRTCVFFVFLVKELILLLGAGNTFSECFWTKPTLVEWLML